MPESWKKLLIMKTTVIIAIVGQLRTISWKPRKENGGTWNLRKNWDCPDDSSAEINKNIYKIPGKMRRLAVIWTLMKITCYYDWESLWRRKMMIIKVWFLRAFANGPGDLGSIPGRVILKTQKIVLDATLLNTQHYKGKDQGKLEQSRERSRALPYTLV